MDLTEKVAIGKIVREKRREKGFTQVETAQKAALSRSYIADIEKGRYAPSVKALTELAKCLGLDLNFLTRIDGNTSQRGAGLND